MNWWAKWIIPVREYGDVAPVFQKEFSCSTWMKCQSAGTVRSAKLIVTALGVYEVTLNGKRVGNEVLTPGWTTYHHRLQYQEYDVTEWIQSENRI